MSIERWGPGGNRESIYNYIERGERGGGGEREGKREGKRERYREGGRER